MISAKTDDRDLFARFSERLRGIGSELLFVVCDASAADAIWPRETEFASTVPANLTPACIKDRRSISGAAWDCSFCRR
jgi:hypothetical protein